MKKIAITVMAMIALLAGAKSIQAISPQNLQNLQGIRIIVVSIRSEVGRSFLKEFQKSWQESAVRPVRYIIFIRDIILDEKVVIFVQARRKMVYIHIFPQTAKTKEIKRGVEIAISAITKFLNN